MRGMATWCVRHRRIVVLLWILVLVLATFLSRAIGTNYNNTFALPHTESTEAIQLLQQVSPAQSGDTEQVVFQATGGAKVTDPDVVARINATLAHLDKLPHVSTIAPYPFTPSATARISKDGTITFATVTFDRQSQFISDAASKKFVATAQAGATDNLNIQVAGQVAEQANKAAIGGTGLGILLAAVVLLVVFGSVFAAALPLLSALASLGTAIGVIGVLSNVLKMPVFSTELVLLVGLGVGVDYALFIVTRHRQGLLAGGDTESSIVTAVDTSGRAVLFAGIIVCIALLGMFALGVTFFYGLAVAAAIGVAFTMFAALTFLPAMLGFIGPRVLSRRQKKSLAEHGPRIVGSGSKGFWAKWADFVRQRPVVPMVVALVVVGLLAAPFFSLRLGISDQGNDPSGTTTRQAYDLLAKGFGPGFNGPLLLVAVEKGSGKVDEAALTTLHDKVAVQPDVASVVPPQVITGKDGTQVALVTVYPTSAPQDGATTDLIDHLRSSTIPAAVAGSGLQVYVGGDTALFADFSTVLSSKLPLFIGLVVLLSFILLAIVFRSIVIPVTAAIMNLLSIGAAFGILVAVFQWGWAGSLFEVYRAGPIESFLPVMLFAILFGLSMDYEVFLITRIHEEWLKSGDNTVAVRNGLAATGKTITAAALIMILVFGSFILGGERIIKEFGLGLAAGILVDAVFIRMAIVPSIMQLLGRWNWWFPSWLDRILPHLSVDPEGSLSPEELAGTSLPVGEDVPV